MKKSTPRPSHSEAKQLIRQKGETFRKSETKVVPDEKDGTLPYVKSSERAAHGASAFGNDQAAHGAAAKRASNPAQPVVSEAELNKEEGQLSVDVFQTASEIVIVAPVAGVKLDDLSINITDEVLTIKGQRNFQFNVSMSDYFTQECFWGNFSRSVILPESVDVSKVTSSFKNGILTVRIPKVERIRTRMVKIKEE